MAEVHVRLRHASFCFRASPNFLRTGEQDNLGRGLSQLALLYSDSVSLSSDVPHVPGRMHGCSSSLANRMHVQTCANSNLSSRRGNVSAHRMPKLRFSTSSMKKRSLPRLCIECQNPANSPPSILVPCWLSLPPEKSGLSAKVTRGESTEI